MSYPEEPHICDACGSKSLVLKTTRSPGYNGSRRDRACRGCGRRWRTVEIRFPPGTTAAGILELWRSGIEKG